MLLPSPEQLADAFSACQQGPPEARHLFLGLLDCFRPTLVFAIAARHSRKGKLHIHDAEDAVAGALSKTWSEVLTGTCLPPRKSWYLKLLARSRTFWNMEHRKTSRFAALEGDPDSVDGRSPPDGIVPEKEIDAPAKALHQHAAADAEEQHITRTLAVNHAGASPKALLAEVEAVVPSLTPKQRATLLHWLEGRSHAEIAALANISEGSSRVLLNRILKRLRISFSAVNVRSRSRA